MPQASPTPLVMNEITHAFRVILVMNEISHAFPAILVMNKQTDGNLYNIVAEKGVFMTDKQIKRYFDMTALGFFSYAILIQLLAVLAALLIELLFPALSSGAMYYSMILSVIPCMLFLYFLFRNNNLVSLTESRVDTASRFSPLVFIHFFLLFCGVQWISSLLTMPLIFLFQKIGLDLSYSEMAAKGGALNDVPMLVYTVLIAPVVEELIFRGIFYKRFKAFGSFFTAFACSLFFALIHSNFLQFIPAFMMGFVLFAIRDKYGLRYSILLHLTNNALAILVNNLSTTVPLVSYIYGFLLLGGGIYTLVSLVKKREKLAALRPDPEGRKALKLFFSSPLVWLDIVVLVILAIVILFNPGTEEMTTTV